MHAVQKWEEKIKEKEDKPFKKTIINMQLYVRTGKLHCLFRQKTFSVFLPFWIVTISTGCYWFKITLSTVLIRIKGGTNTEINPHW